VIATDETVVITIGVGIMKGDGVVLLWSRSVEQMQPSTRRERS